MQNLNAIQKMVTNTGESLHSLSFKKPTLLIFLRHFGCIFCREALKEISNKRSDFDEKGVQIVFVHMTDFETAEDYFNKYGIDHPTHISDPECKYYSAFGLAKGSISQLFGLKTMLRGIEVTMKGTTFGLKQIGDGFQMPGIFMINNGRIADSYIHKTASDKPDYDDIIKCCAA